MADNVFFSEDAKRDIYKAKCQYDLMRKGDLFLDDIFNTLEFVKLMPEVFQIRYDGMRIVALENFSFNIHYELINDSIKVYRVLHQRQSY